MKRNRLMAFLLVLCLVLAWVPVSARAEEADSGKCGDDITWSFVDGVLTLTGTGPMYDYEEVYIGEGLFASTPWMGFADEITTVVLSDGITKVGNYAFAFCESLSRIVFSSDIQSIGDYAFYWCWSLYELVIPEGVTELGNHIVQSCGVETVYFPSTLKKVGEWDGFYGWFNDLYVPSMEDWCEIEFADGYGMFFSNRGDHRLHIGGELVTDIVIPYGVTKIGDNQFKYYPYMTSIVLPNSVEYIGSNAFQGGDQGSSYFYGGVSEIVLPASVEMVCADAFKCLDDVSKIVVWNPDCVLNDAMFSTRYYYYGEDYYFDDNGELVLCVGWFDERAWYGKEDMPLPVIYGWPGSTAETYAQFAGFEFVALRNYVIISEFDPIWVADGNESMVIHIDADVSNFCEVRINGRPLESGHYTLSDGSTIVTLKPEYLATLPAGEYAMEIIFTNGSAEATFHITGSAVVLGDLTGDGEVDIFDANLIVAYYNGTADLTAEQQKAADVNGDGEVDIFDANLVVSYYNGTLTAFPVEQ